MHSFDSKFIIVGGALGGDEGKGRIVDELITRYSNEYGVGNVVVCGPNGGSNAGHSIFSNGREYNVHYLTSGSASPGIMQVLGAGKVIEPISLQQELYSLNDIIDLIDRTFIDERTHITTILHLIQDRGILSKEIGTTCKGIGPTYATKHARTGIRICDAMRMTDEELLKKLHTLYDRMGFNKDMNLNFEYIDYMNNKYILNTNDILSGEHDLKNIRWIHNTFKIVNHMWFREKVFNLKNKIFIFELSNATLLDITNGTYPNVTSSNCTANTILDSFGLSLSDIVKISDNLEVIGVVKSYPTRVGSGCLPSLMTEEDSDIAETIIMNGKEYGVTTGRKRRPGWTDVVLINYSCKINGYTCLNITRLDNLSHCDKIKICFAYTDKNNNYIDFFPSSDEELSHLEPVYAIIDGWKDFDFTKVKEYNDLHPNVKIFIDFIEKKSGVPVKYINTGRERGMMIVK